MKEYISNCCGAKLYHPDIAMCKDCGEHCGVEEIVEDLNHPYGGLEVLDNVPPETLEDRFNKEFVDEDTGLLNISKYDHERLLEFIHTLLEKQREEYVEMIEKYKLEQIDKFDGEYSLYLDDIINLIKPHDKTS